MAWIEDSAATQLINLDEVQTITHSSTTTTNVIVGFVSGSSTTISYATEADAEAAYEELKGALGVLYSS